LTGKSEDLSIWSDFRATQMDTRALAERAAQRQHKAKDKRQQQLQQQQQHWASSNNLRHHYGVITDRGGVGGDL